MQNTRDAMIDITVKANGIFKNPNIIKARVTIIVAINPKNFILFVVNLNKFSIYPKIGFSLFSFK